MEEYIIYFWQGRESSQDEKGASAILATQLDDEVCAASVLAPAACACAGSSLPLPVPVLPAC